MQAQIAVYNGRITQLNNQLVELRTKLNKLRPGTAGYDTVKRRALQVLQQKRMYEQQRDKIQDQLFSVEQARFQSQALQDTVSQMKTMRDTHKLIKKEFKVRGERERERESGRVRERERIALQERHIIYRCGIIYVHVYWCY